MPEYTVTVKLTKKDEAAFVRDMANEMNEYLCNDLAHDYALDHGDIMDLKSHKSIMTHVRRIARTLTEQALETTVAEFEAGEFADVLRERVYDFVYDWEDLRGADDLVDDLKAVFAAKKDFVNLAATTKEQRLEASKREILRLAKEIEATVTFAGDEE